MAIRNGNSSTWISVIIFFHPGTFLPIYEFLVACHTLIYQGVTKNVARDPRAASCWLGYQLKVALISGRLKI